MHFIKRLEKYRKTNSEHFNTLAFIIRIYNFFVYQNTVFLKKYAVTVELEVIQELCSTALHDVSVENESETVTEDSESEVPVIPDSVRISYGPDYYLMNAGNTALSKAPMVRTRHYNDYSESISKMKEDHTWYALGMKTSPPVKKSLSNRRKVVRRRQYALLGLRLISCSS